MKNKIIMIPVNPKAVFINTEEFNKQLPGFSERTEDQQNFAIAWSSMKYWQQLRATSENAAYLGEGLRNAVESAFHSFDFEEVVRLTETLAMAVNVLSELAQMGASQQEWCEAHGGDAELKASADRIRSSNC